MRTFLAFIRLWAKGLKSGQTRSANIVRWISLYPLALWSALVTLGLIRPFPVVTPFGLYYGSPDHTLHPFGFHAVLLAVLILVFASYEAGVAWTRATGRPRFDVQWCSGTDLESGKHTLWLEVRNAGGPPSIKEPHLDIKAISRDPGVEFPVQLGKWQALNPGEPAQRVKLLHWDMQHTMFVTGGPSPVTFIAEPCAITLVAHGLDEQHLDIIFVTEIGDDHFWRLRRGRDSDITAFARTQET